MPDAISSRTRQRLHSPYYSTLSCCILSALTCVEYNTCFPMAGVRTLAQDLSRRQQGENGPGNFHPIA